MPKQNLTLIKQLLISAEKSIKKAYDLLAVEEKSTKSSKKVGKKEDLSKKAAQLSIIEEGKIIEGVFDGQNMIGPDGKLYPVPANYASKSKLVEGDLLKLTIQKDGSFIFKQIGPVERKKMIGVVTRGKGEELVVEAEGKKYRVLRASITYFNAEEGDKVTIIVPKDKESSWAAIENIIKKEKEVSKAILEEETKIEEDKIEELEEPR